MQIHRTALGEGLGPQCPHSVSIGKVLPRTVFCFVFLAIKQEYIILNIIVSIVIKKASKPVQQDSRDIRFSLQPQPPRVLCDQSYYFFFHSRNDGRTMFFIHPIYDLGISSTLEISQIRGHRHGSIAPPRLAWYNIPSMFITRRVQPSLWSSNSVEFLFYWLSALSTRKV